MSALIDGEGAKMPPGTPHQAVGQVAMNLSTERVPVDGGVGDSQRRAYCIRPTATCTEGPFRPIDRPAAKPAALTDWDRET